MHANHLLSLAFLSLIIGLSSKQLFFWDADGVLLVGAFRALGYVSVACLLLAILLSKFKLNNFRLNPYIFAGGTLVYFFGNWLYNNYGLIQAPSGRGLIILFTLLSLPFIILKKEINWSLVAILLLVYLSANFLAETKGAIITSDDHATFLHRLILLKENFPNIPIYDPLWNSGYDQRYFFATGSLNIFLLTFPLTYFFEPKTVYNLCIVFIVYILPFLSCYMAARILKFSSNTAWIAATLALAPCSEWLKWGLQYGTMGFVTAAGLLPLNLALSIRILDTKMSFPLVYALLLIVSFTLMLFWSASGLVFLPLIAVALVKIFSHKLLKKNYITFVIVSLLILNLPWITVFYSVSNVGKFVSAEQSQEQATFKHKSGDFDFKKALKQSRQSLSNFNPVILLMFLPGVLILPLFQRSMYLSVLGWLFFLGAFCIQIKPQFELDRMLVIFSLIACIPAAAATEKIFAQPKRFVQIAVTGLLAGFFIAVPVSSASIVRRKTLIPYYVEGEFTRQMIAELKKYQNQGRILFSGFILHEMDGGHIAPFTEFTKTPLIASSPVHNQWTYKQIFPEEFLARGDSGIQQYLNANNVTMVFAHEPHWRKYFKDRKQDYQFIKSIGSFWLFKRRNYNNNYFYQGQGKILEQNNHSLTVKINSNTAVIKFRYFDFLESSDCKLVPEKISDSLSLIKITNCKAGQTLTIKSKPAWKRIKL